MRKLIAIGSFALSLAACASTEEPPVQSESTTTMDAAGTTTTTEIKVDDMFRPDPDLNRVVSSARADLSSRLGVAEEDIDVTLLETGAWRDGSLGCPQPDMLYTQALVPGTRVALTHGKEMYWYHQGGSGEVFLCAEPAEDAFIGSSADELIPPPGYNE